jgi:4-amino-4-deoxy-L-arabinose transferase-like glycosyltransferase
MKCIACFNNLHLKRNLNPYRITVGAGFIISAALILLTPLQMPDPDDWAYYNGVLNFSRGHFTIDNSTVMQQSEEIGRQGGFLLQYLPINFNKWALEKAPGVVFYLIPFKFIGLIRWSNILLALGMVIVTYILLKRLRDEKAAMIGSLLMLFTPIGMVMLNRVYMDTYASLAFLVIGAGLYLYYHLERRNLTPVKGGTLLFLAFFFTGLSVIVRYTNLPIAVILALHLVVTRLIAWRKKQGTGVKPEIIPLVLGIGLPVLAILLYDYFVFGSPLKYGYSYSPFPIKFAFQYIGKVDAQGVSIPLQILRYNTQGYLRNFLIGFPLMIIGIPGFLVVLYYKFFRKSRPEGTWSGLRSELPWDILLVLIGWFVSVFLLYLGYEWTAGLQKGGGFVLFNRFLLPGLFPAVVICALIMARFPYKVLIPVLVILVVYGSLLYAQWALNLHILPAWLTERTLDTRWPGYVFPPWTKAGIQFYYFKP